MRIEYFITIPTQINSFAVVLQLINTPPDPFFGTIAFITEITVWLNYTITLPFLGYRYPSYSSLSFHEKIINHMVYKLLLKLKKKGISLRPAKKQAKKKNKLKKLS